MFKLFLSLFCVFQHFLCFKTVSKVEMRSSLQQIEHNKCVLRGGLELITASLCFYQLALHRFTCTHLQVETAHCQAYGRFYESEFKKLFCFDFRSSRRQHDPMSPHQRRTCADRIYLFQLEYALTWLPGTDMFVLNR